MVRPRLSRRSDAWWVLLALAVFTVAAPATAQTQAQTRLQIVQLVDGAYRVSDGSETTIFAVTPAGIILADVPNRAFALALKQELAERFPRQPATQIVASHYTFERFNAASEFHATAELFSQWNYTAQMRRDTRDRPGLVIRRTQVYYSEGFVTVGGTTVEAAHIETAATPDATILWLPREGIAFAADAPLIGQTGFRLTGYTAKDTLTWLRAVNSVPFGYLLTGRGETLNKQRIADCLQYFEELYQHASEARANRPLGSIPLEPHVNRTSGPGQRDRDADFARFYNAMRVLRVDAYGAAVGDRLDSLPNYCNRFTTCDNGGWVGAGIGGVRAAYGWIGGAIEARYGMEHHAARTSLFYDDAMTFRTFQFSWLFRVSPPPLRSFTYALVAGPSTIHGDTQTVTVARATPAGAGGPILFHNSESRTGFTIGADLAMQLGATWRIEMPLRFTTNGGTDVATWLGDQRLQVGIGISTTAYRRIFLQ